MVWFETPIGQGVGDVEFVSNGELKGGDSTFVYSGTWVQAGERFKAFFHAKRVVDGPPGVFGRDELDIVSGISDGSASASCKGFAKQVPGLELAVKLTPIV